MLESIVEVPLNAIKHLAHSEESASSEDAPIKASIHEESKYDQEYIEHCIHLYRNTIKYHLGKRWQGHASFIQKVDKVIEWLDELYTQGIDPENQASIQLSVRQHAGLVMSSADRGMDFLIIDVLLEGEKRNVVSQERIQPTEKKNKSLNDLMESTQQWIHFYELVLGAATALQGEAEREEVAYACDVFMQRILDTRGKRMEWLKCSRLLRFIEFSLKLTKIAEFVYTPEEKQHLRLENLSNLTYLYRGLLEMTSVLRSLDPHEISTHEVNQALENLQRFEHFFPEGNEKLTISEFAHFVQKIIGIHVHKKLHRHLDQIRQLEKVLSNVFEDQINIPSVLNDEHKCSILSIPSVTSMMTFVDAPIASLLRSMLLHDQSVSESSSLGVDISEDPSSILKKVIGKCEDLLQEVKREISMIDAFSERADSLALELRTLRLELCNNRDQAASLDEISLSTVKYLPSVNVYLHLRILKHLAFEKLNRFSMSAALEPKIQGLFSFKHVLIQESKEHILRRRIAGVSSSTKFGVCFSGGGIRSASFHFGFLEVLAQFGLAKHIDYISTVSGGGYTASAYLTHLKNEWSETGGQVDIDSLHQKAVSKTKMKMLDNPCFIGNFEEPFTAEKDRSYLGITRSLYKRALRLVDGSLSFLIFISLVPLSLVYTAFVAFLVGNYLALNIRLYFRDCFIKVFEDPENPNLGECTTAFLTYFSGKAAIILVILAYYFITLPFRGTIIHPRRLSNSTWNAIRYTLTSTALIFGITLIGYLIEVALISTELMKAIWQTKALTSLGLIVFAVVLCAFAFRIEVIIGLIYVIVIFLLFGIWGCIAQIITTASDSSRGTNAFTSVLLALPIILLFLRHVKGIMLKYYSWRLKSSFFCNSTDANLNEFSCSASGAPLPYYICSASRNNIFSETTSQSYGLFSLTPKFIGAREIQYAPTHTGISLSTAVGLSAAVISQSMGKYVVVDNISVLGGFLSIGLGDWVSLSDPYKISIPWVGTLHLDSIFEFIYYIPVLLFIAQNEAASWIATSLVFFINIISFFGSTWSWAKPLLKSVPLLTIHQAMGASFVIDDAKSENGTEERRGCLRPAENLYPPMVFVSDGGHFENLGLLELLRRRCSVILSGDNGFDPEGKSESLFYALDMARREGIDFTVPSDSIYNGISVAKRIDTFCSSSEPFLHLKVSYPQNKAEFDADMPSEADLFYVKGKLNPDDREYGGWRWKRGGFWCECCHRRSVDPAALPGEERPSKCTCFFDVFPFHSTAIQFFSKAMMLNYMNLGKTQSAAACREIERIIFNKMNTTRRIKRRQSQKKIIERPSSKIVS